MLHLSLFLEILRQRPRLVFWVVTLTQAALWVLVPSLFYSAPPTNLLELLAIGRGLGTAPQLGPPLAYWAANLAFDLAGHRVVGVYILAQLCVVVTYWAVFTLGRALVGDRQAVLAILLMAGISALSVPTPDFNAALLTMPLWSLAALFLWRAAGEDRPLYWLALAADLGLMLLTGYLTLVLVVLLLAFCVSHPFVRARLRSFQAGAAAAIVVAMALPAFAYVHQAFEGLPSHAFTLRSVETVNQNLVAWLKLAGIVVVSHAGLLILAALAINAVRLRQFNVSAIEGKPVADDARGLVYYLALMPPIVVTVAGAIAGYASTLNPAPLVVFTGLALVVAAGPRIEIYNQRVLSWVWAGLLFIPPVLVAIFVTAAPVLLGTDLKVAQPASTLGRFFAENFERRTGRPLAIVGGDKNLALLVAAGAPSRPAVIVDEAGFPKYISDADIAEKGAIIVWPATDNAGTPPRDIKARFPTIAPEVPRAFERPIQGWQPLLRVGWGMIRPASAPAPDAPAAPATPAQ